MQGVLAGNPETLFALEDRGAKKGELLWEKF
jgi:hypothetical protein